MSATYQPFSNGAELMGWLEFNCCLCKKATWDTEAGEAGNCPIQDALMEPISKAIALRMGYIVRGAERTEPLHCPDCAERDYTDEVKDDLARRRVPQLPMEFKEEAKP